MSCRGMGGFVALNYPDYPHSLAASLVVTDTPDPDKVNELISITRRHHEQAKKMAAEINELRCDNARLEHTIRLLSVEEAE